MNPDEREGRKPTVADRREVLHALNVAVTLTTILDFRPEDQSPVADPLSDLHDGWSGLRNTGLVDWEDLQELGDFGEQIRQGLLDRFAELSVAAGQVSQGLQTLEPEQDATAVTTDSLSLDVRTVRRWRDVLESVQGLWEKLETALHRFGNGQAVSDDLRLVRTANEADEAAIEFCGGLALDPDFWGMYVRLAPSGRTSSRNRMVKYLASALQRRWSPLGASTKKIAAWAKRQRTGKAELKRRALAGAIIDRETTTAPRSPNVPSKNEYLRFLAEELSRAIESDHKRVDRGEKRSHERKVALGVATGKDSPSDSDGDTRLTMDRRLLDGLDEQHESERLRLDLAVLRHELSEDAHKLLAVMEAVVGDNVLGASKLLGWPRHRARQARREIEEVASGF